jgi:dienelactone hydrolase
MYGAIEWAEHVDAGLANAPATLEGRPWLARRGINLFLTLPWNEETNEPDYDAAALADPARWWFHDESYWTSLFDLMARSRLNWLDLHGTYDIQTTRFPNLYAYFVDSVEFPEVGVAREIKQKNLAQLGHVIELAHARGVKVTLMSYEARFDVPHKPKVPYASNEDTLYRYTRDVVEALVRGAPGLDGLGFRIGESGHGADFFRCYTEGVAKSGRDLPLLTRSWITRKSQVVPLACASSDFTVEIKYNGEHWGPPYPIAGGRMASWYSYSFEDYFSDSNVAAAKRMWPGNLADNGEQWPSEPYRVAWQVRANGTHRIFPFYEPTLVRRTITAMKLGTADGFCVEPLNAYYPPSPRYYTADPNDIAFRWIHQRDEPWWRCWGRLGYDPKTSDAELDRFAQHHLECDEHLIVSWKAASRIVPTAFTAFSLGPDHRNHAPELEWGGDTATLATTQGFDSHVFRSAAETAAYRALGVEDGRFDPLVAGERIDLELGWILGARNAGRPARGRPAQEIERTVKLLDALGMYYLARLRTEELWTGVDDSAAREFREADTELLRHAVLAWRELTHSIAARSIRPIPEHLRMGRESYHWSRGLEAVERELGKLTHLDAIESLGEGLRAQRALDISYRLGTSPHASYAGPTLSWASRGQSVRVSVPALTTYDPWLLVKPLPSSTFFHRVSFRREGDEFVADVPRLRCGQLLAADVRWFFPDYRARIPRWPSSTPYLVVPARSGPTPLYYSSEEALSYLDPKSLDPAKHGMLLVCPRAGNFFWRFGARDKRKLLDAVERGMRLVVMQQDYASGRYKLDWLPGAPKIESAATNAFDAGGAFGLVNFTTDDILWQPIRASDGWELLGNGAIARKSYGKGEVVLVQARLQQRMHIPGAAKAIKALLELNGREKPLVIVDPGTEDASYATSIFPDFCNALDIPFLTLGEVIAEEQGLVTTKIAGPVAPESVLDGKGGEMVAKWLREKVRAAAERPVPASRAELEQRQLADKPELMRALGLDPLPPRTPLDARITGVLQRNGYRVEKLCFESRPGVAVTANVYWPDPLPREPLPVIVNPHGHWQHKKSEPVVQTRAIAQALAGYCAIVVDSPGHSFEGDTPVERRELGSHDDLRLVAASNTTGVYVWDLMRALDYLETRPEADTTRVGITGASGGGLATLYAFAADERFDVAVPVVYATSLAVNPNNGCLCNHVPGTLRIGDRADVLAIRAPAPVLVIGAQDDGEFPPEGTRRTAAKLAELWKLFGAESSVAWKLFDGPHDYSKSMRESALGFFDFHLRQLGDGSPRPEPAIAPEPADTRELDAADRESSSTMRELARAALADPTLRDAAWPEVLALNGGAPERCELDVQVLDAGESGVRPKVLTLQSERGLRIPGVLHEPPMRTSSVLVLFHEGNKADCERVFGVSKLVAAGHACLCIDVRGFGELPGLDPRLMAYLGTADAFAMGWDAARAAEAMLASATDVIVVGSGPCASQAAMYAALFEPRLRLAVGLEGLASPLDALRDDVPAYCVQPRAVFGGVRVPHPSALLGKRARHHLRGESVDLVRELTW